MVFIDYETRSNVNNNQCMVIMVLMNAASINS